MNVAEFIKWLETKPQHLEVAVLEVSTEYVCGDSGEDVVAFTQAVCFDNPQVQSEETKLTLTLGVV